MQFDAEQLLLKLNQGQSLDDEELQFVSTTLQMNLERACISADEVYGLVAVLLKLQVSAHLELFDSYFAQQDPLLCCLILESLVLDWNLVDEYSSDLLALASGAEWDEESDLQICAFGIIAELHARKVKMSEGLRRSSYAILLKVFDSPKQDSFLRQAAYRALLRSLSVPKAELPSEYRRLDLSPGSSDIAWDAVARCRELAQLPETQSCIPAQLPSD